MSSPNDHEPSNAGPSDDLKGLDILLVEDLRDVGEAVKKHLELLGAKVAGPAATTAEAEGLLNEHPPDVALVDFHLREGERSDGLIARLHERGVPVIMLSGSFEFSSAALGGGHDLPGETGQRSTASRTPKPADCKEGDSVRGLSFWLSQRPARIAFKAARASSKLGLSFVSQRNAAWAFATIAVSGWLISCVNTLLMA